MKGCGKVAVLFGWDVEKANTPGLSGFREVNFARLHIL